MGWVVNATLLPLLPQERPGTHLQEAVWAPVPVWKGAENLDSTGFRSPDRPTHSESTCLQVVKNFPAFNVTRRFITAFTYSR